MSLLSRDEFVERLNKSRDDAIWVDPLLDERQIGDASVDLRLGYDFLVSILTRSPFIGLDPDAKNYRPIKSFFQVTRRDIGDNFVVYPNQVVIATSLEYVAMPNDVYADILTRSSYNRLGMQLKSMLQPGYRGCVPVELFNHGNTPVELIVGTRIIQARFIKSEHEADYHDTRHGRKYIGNVRPTYSRAQSDYDIRILRRMSLQE